MITARTPSPPCTQAFSVERGWVGQERHRNPRCGGRSTGVPTPSPPLPRNHGILHIYFSYSGERCRRLRSCSGSRIPDGAHNIYLLCVRYMVIIQDGYTFSSPSSPKPVENDDDDDDCIPTNEAYDEKLKTQEARRLYLCKSQSSNTTTR
jgi:hypothetical protein